MDNTIEFNYLEAVVAGPDALPMCLAFTAALRLHHGVESFALDVGHNAYSISLKRLPPLTPLPWVDSLCEVFKATRLG